MALPIVVLLSRVCATRKRSASCSSSWARVTSERPGGYLRILKCGFRPGDNAPMAYVELVGRPQVEAVDAE